MPATEKYWSWKNAVQCAESHARFEVLLANFFYAGILLGLFFDHEEGENILLRKVG
jgi:hypothetical protein